LAPPVLYIVTFQIVEQKIQRACERQIQEIYIGDTAPLFEGTITLKQAINQNINRYLSNNILFAWGLKANITVSTRSGSILYPPIYPSPSESISVQPSSLQIAEENYALLSEDLVLSVDLKLSHTHFIPLSFLIFYILCAVSIFYFHVQSGLKKIAAEKAETDRELQRLGEQQQEVTQRMLALNLEKEKLNQTLEDIRARLENEREKATRNEDEMINEIVALEEKLKKNRALQEEQQEKIEALTQETKDFESGVKKGRKQRAKASEIARKRFKTLYKNVSFHSKAVGGFADLTNELQLKAEEIILQLNEDPQKVPVKRKVFGKKNRETVFEVIFAYKGRIYYRNTKDSKLEILSVGTKQTQAKDLQFLDTI
jgi:hypothetical protein